ncbi:TDP-N-acetylfucosamine:lipid II N-acetylfucosaminyltransferase [Serratia aquatilis]|uniref:TDP-N-acetylfucosamine:lipid II N-acetylfucosaminyltransferase n=1 Tax=Serratia aquatilis TaxID=1737515 RepID=A0ABV6EJW8_9GAMM
MKKLKILHLCTDEKFIDRAIATFETAYPKQNIVCVYNNKEKISYIKSDVDFTAGFKESLVGLDFSKIGEIDILVVHSLRDFWFRTIEKLDKNIPIVWIGWGYDYYDLIGGDDKWLLKDTLALSGKLKKSKTIKQRIKELVMYPAVRRTKVIERIQYFTPVIPAEYEILKDSREWRTFPSQVDWNYAAAEKDLSSYISDAGIADVKRDNILLGNSATCTNNHVEIFKILKEINLEDRKLIIPLNYGDKDYGGKIHKAANNMLGRNADVLVDFMPIEEYMRKISSCGIVIMNHIRQQGVGNIISMLYLGAKVFLREENPTFNFLKSRGAIIFSIQELERDPHLLKSLLIESEVVNNREVIETIWSNAVLLEKTKKMISSLIGKEK